MVVNSMALGLGLRGSLALGIDLDDLRAGNDLLIGEIGVGLGEDDIGLALDASRDAIDLVVRIALSDADLNRVLQVRLAGDDESV